MSHAFRHPKHRCSAVARAGWPRLLALGFAFALATSAAEVSRTNTPSRWPSLSEVRGQWDATPIPEVQRAAEKGDLTAQHYLGFLYRDGTGVPADPVESLRWFRLAAAQGHTVAMVNVGRAYRFGSAVRRDPQEAIRWFRLASEHGEPLGSLNLGWMYGYEADAPKNQTLAAQLYRQAAAQGQPDAMYELYLSYWNGRGVPRDWNEAMQWLVKGAEAGCPNAQCTFGYRHENPTNRAPANLPEAVRWYRRAAEQGHSGGQYHLGLCYLEGGAVEWDEERGLELIRQAADQGHLQALCKLAELYAQGVGEPRSAQDRPIQLLERAARKGSGEAYEALVFRCQFGFGTERDLVAAAEWYCRAALAGTDRFPLEAKAERSAAVAFRSLPERSLILVRQPCVDPLGTPRLLAALSLYKAASQNESRALMQLGQKYLAGSDAPKSPAKAWLWFTLAARSGSTEARTRLSGIEANLTGKELAEARRLLPGLAQQLQEVAAALPHHAGSGAEE